MSDENTNNSNNIKEVFLLPGILLGVLFLAAVYLLLQHVVPTYSEAFDLKSSYSDKNTQYEAAMNQIESIRKKNDDAKEATKNSDGVDKEFFRPLEAGVDSESIIASEFSEILELMKSNMIKTRAVKYTYDPEDDNFVKGAGNKFSVCQLDMEMIVTYTNFKNFMKDLYKHEHYLDIASVEIIPYHKNKTILIIRMQLKLYAERV